jgi:hypothetical protein
MSAGFRGTAVGGRYRNRHRNRWSGFGITGTGKADFRLRCRCRFRRLRQNDCGLIRRRERFRFLHLHLFLAALELAFACFGAKDLCSADLTFVSLSQLTHCRLFRSLFFLFHWLAAAVNRPVSGTGYDHLCAAFCAFVAFAYLVCHCFLPLQLDFFQITGDQQFRFRDRLNILHGKARENFFQ